jgi:hypothetical protein
MKERYEKIVEERLTLQKPQPEKELENRLEEIRKEKEEARREKEENLKQKEELQRQMEEIRNLTAQARIGQQRPGPLGYGVPGQIPQVRNVQTANLIENEGRDFTGNNPIVCYNCETLGHPESRCWKPRLPPEIRAENVQRINV